MFSRFKKLFVFFFIFFFFSKVNGLAIASAEIIFKMTEDSGKQNADKEFNFKYDFLNLNYRIDLLDNIIFLGNSYSPSFSGMQSFEQSDYLGFNQYCEYKSFIKINPSFQERNTELIFKSASKRNLELEVNHNQKLGSNISFNLDFLTARSLGFYSKQESNFKKINFDFLAKSKNQKFTSRINYFNLKFNNKESGGLQTDSSFTESGKQNTQLYSTKLNSSNSILIDKNWLIENTFLFINKYYKGDSLLANGAKKLFIKSEFHFNRQSFLFNSDSKEELFFENNFFDTTKTRDTLWYKNYSHCLSLNLLGYSNQSSLFKNFSSSMYFENSLVKLGQNEVDSSFRENRYGARFEYSPQNLNLSCGAHFFIGNMIENNNLSSTGFSFFTTYDLRKDLWLKFLFENAQRTPTIIENSFYSNHFIWKNNFSNLNVRKIKLQVQSDKLKSAFETSFESYKNYIYFDVGAQPKQTLERFNYLKLSFSNRLSLGKFWFENYLIYRKSHDENIFRVPEFSSLTNFYYSKKIFKNHLEIQPGFSLRYFTSFFGNSYQPATGQFYLQNETEIGNYPYFDVFINMNIKNATLMIMLEHVNAGLNGKNYFGAPHYPMPGRSLKFVVKWNLVN